MVGRLLEAVHFSALKHKDQRRKDPEKTPYINHPIGVAYILWKEAGVSDVAVLQVSLHVLVYLCTERCITRDKKHKQRITM